MKVGVVKENAFAIILALILAFVVMLFVSRTDFLKADILWVDPQELEVVWDVVASFDWSLLTIKSNTNLEWVNVIAFDMIYNIDEIDIYDSLVSTSFNYSKNTTTSEGKTTFILSSVWSVSVDQDLISIDIDSYELNISDFVVSFTDWTTERLAITTDY